MAEYTASIQWARGADEAFVDQRYSREHEWVFDGGVRVPASSSPHVVPLPYSVEANVDPEEAFEPPRLFQRPVYLSQAASPDSSS